MRIYQREGLQSFANAFQEVRRNIAADTTNFMKEIHTLQEANQ